jgi:hypothetical protein
MTSIILNSITGLNYPYDIYVCDVYGNNCGYISQINTPVPASVEIVLPPPFNTAPAVGIKIITSDGCERFRVIDCYLIDGDYLISEIGDFLITENGLNLIIE